MPTDEDVRRYRRRKRAATLASLTATAALLLAAFLAGPAEALRDAIEGLTGIRAVRVALFFTVLFAAIEAVQVVPGFYGGHILERRVGLSVQSPASWLADRAKALGVGFALGLPTAVGVYALIDAFPAAWWALAAGGLWLAAAALSNVAPKIILRLFFRFDPLPEGPVKARLLALCERAGVPAVEASVWRLSAKSRRSNAAVVGWGNTRRVIVADTLLDTYSPEEIEAVLAHELGHHVSGDIRNGILFQLPLMFAGFLVLHAVSGWLLAPLGLDTRADLAGMPLLGLILLGASLAALPLASTFSRWREGAADAFALRITGDPEAFIGAMEKLAGQNLADRRPRKLVEVLMHSHPAIDRRIARARAWAAQQPAAATVSGEGDAS